MNQEIERKYRISESREVMMARLKSLGAEEIGSSFMDDEYFIVPEKSVRTCYLRIRRKNNAQNGSLDYHEVVDEYLTNEWETQIGDCVITSQILHKLGYETDVIVSKKRVSFQLNYCEILFDQVQDLGNYIEIEASSEESLDKIAGLIFDKKPEVVSGVGYPDLIREKKSKVKT